MKKSNRYFLASRTLKTILFFTLVSVIPAWRNLHAQDVKQQKENNKEASVKKMIDSKRFQFVAQSAMPMSGQIRQLTTEYGLSLKNDTLESFLPYFGRAYSATIGSGRRGDTIQEL
jgi:hypothetical protein